MVLELAAEKVLLRVLKREKRGGREEKAREFERWGGKRSMTKEAMDVCGSGGFDLMRVAVVGDV